MDPNKVYTAIGMMSGTSLDGIDVALVTTDGKDFTLLRECRTIPYSAEERHAIRLALGHKKPSDITDHAADIITQKHIAAVRSLNCSADVIGFHGQTILHDPPNKISWQIGDPQLLADAVGIDVVADMRQADIAAGGQGAPLLPLCHRAFASDIKKPIAIVNLGGVANITYLGVDRQDILAFDTGPANALMDDLVLKTTGRTYDKDGEIASKGTPDYRILDQWLAHPYFNQAPPKSLDRDEWDVRAVYNMPIEDAMATLAEFTVLTLLRSFSLLPAKPHRIFVTGGGRHNKFIMSKIQKAAFCPVKPVEAIGWNGDALEAQGFAYLAVRSLLGLALTLPSTTGIDKPATGGVLYVSEKSVTKRHVHAN